MVQLQGCCKLISDLMAEPVDDVECVGLAGLDADTQLVDGARTSFI